MDSVLRARIGGLCRAAKYDGHAVTAAGRRAFLDSFAAAVDPDHQLSEAERERRATALRRAHMLKLALASAKARRKRSQRETA